MVHNKATGGWVSDIFSYVFWILFHELLSPCYLEKFMHKTIKDKKFGVEAMENLSIFQRWL